MSVSVELMTGWLSLSVVLGFALLSGGLSVYLWRRVRALESQLAQLQTQHQHIADTAVAVGRKLIALQHELQQLAARVQTEPTQNTEYKAYNQATALLQQGVRLDEVIEKCHLTRGEGELLASMHRAAQGERPH